MLDALAHRIKGGLATTTLAAAFAAGCAPAQPAPTRDLVTVEPALAAAAPQPPAGPAAPAGQDSPASFQAQAPKVGPLAQAVRRLIYKGVLIVPEGFRSDDGSYDLIVHFNGHTETVEAALAQNKINAVLYVVNLPGMGSGSYESLMQDAYALHRLEIGVGDGLRLLVPGLKPQARRLALSAWSAGYGGVLKALMYPRSAQRVDAVLLADGLHAGFKPGSRRELSEPLLAPFQRFAVRASHNEVLMGISHTEVQTYTYASTRQTSDGLIASLGLSRVPSSEPPLRTSHATTRADVGDFHVLGYDGDGPEAHSDHLRGLGQTLFPMLAARWAQTPAN